MTSRRTPVFVGLTVAILALAGCASATPGGAPSEDANTGVETLEVSGGWLDGGRLMGIVTQGSSSCVPTASEVVLQADGSVAVTLADDPAAACTRDFVPRVSTVALPAGVTSDDAVDVVVTYGEASGDLALAAYDGPEVQEYSPSAGWVGDGSIAVLTWGSSSCAPTVDSVVSDDPASVTVTFAELPANQACTMDMAPRVVLAHVDGEVDTDAVLTLTGGDLAEPVEIALG